MRHTFEDQIGRNMEVYIDDLVVMPRRKGNLLPDLNETFENLRRNHIKLNPEKCVFGVDARKLLDFMISLVV